LVEEAIVVQLKKKNVIENKKNTCGCVVIDFINHTE